jgi:murein L,D-transpeptidase YafK
MKLIRVIWVCVGLFIVFASAGALPSKTSLPKVTHMHIEKHKRVMKLYIGGTLIKTYRISLGSQPVGPKEREGDGKTPEGNYTISHKNAWSRFHKSLKVSYPNKHDRKMAKKHNVSPGGDIMIHGLGAEFSHLGKSHVQYDWTLGCMAVTNEEIDEIWKMVDVGTPLMISA